MIVVIWITKFARCLTQIFGERERDPGAENVVTFRRKFSPKTGKTGTFHQFYDLESTQYPRSTQFPDIFVDNGDNGSSPHWQTQDYAFDGSNAVSFSRTLDYSLDRCQCSRGISVLREKNHR